MNQGFLNQNMIDPAMLSGIINQGCSVGYPNDFALQQQQFF